MTAETKKGKYVYYRCTGFKGACGNAYVREERLSALLGAVIAPIQITAEIADDIAMALRASDTDAEQRRGARWETELRTIDVERTGLETGAFEPHVRARNSRNYLDFAVRFVGQRERKRNGGVSGTTFATGSFGRLRAALSNPALCKLFVFQRPHRIHS